LRVGVAFWTPMDVINGHGEIVAHMGNEIREIENFMLF
jgi:hypothetical protein